MVDVLTSIILQILFITIGMYALGMIFNYFFGINREEMQKFQDKAKNLQERMKNAQIIGDSQLLLQLQQESMNLTKEMMKKQFLPLCVRCLIFWGIFAVLGAIYSPYSSGLLPFEVPLFGSGWAALYLLFSLGLALTIYIIKKVYKKATGKEDKTKGLLSGMMGNLSGSSESSGTIIHYPSSIQSQAENQPERNERNLENEKESQEKKDSWKDKLES